jgi:hypothetical protein
MNLEQIETNTIHIGSIHDTIEDINNSIISVDDRETVLKGRPDSRNEISSLNERRDLYGCII